MSNLCEHLCEEGVMQAEGIVWFADASYSEYASNPLDDYDSVGVIHANFSSGHGYRSSGGVGDKKEFQSAVGGLYKADEDGVVVSDESYYREAEDEEVIQKASLLVLLEASREQVAQWFAEIQADGVEIEFDEDEDPQDYAVQLQFFIDQANDEWTTEFGDADSMPRGLWSSIMDRAKALADKEVEARVVGDSYAVMLNYRDHGNYGADASVSTPSSSISQQGWSSLDKSDGVWLPDDHLRKELEKLPYHEAMQRALQCAEHATQLFSSWANGEVYRYDIKAYELAFDEDGEPITDKDHYIDEEPLYEDSCGDYYGEEEFKASFEDAKNHVLTKAVDALRQKRNEHQPDLFASSSSTASGSLGL